MTGKHPRDVGLVVAVVGRVVHQEEVAVLHLALAGVVVRPPGVVRARDEREVGVALRAVSPEDELADGVELVLVLARPRRAHAFEDREARELRRVAQHRELARALDEAQVVERRREIADLEDREALAHELDEAALPRGHSVERVRADLGDAAQREVAAHRRALGGRHGREENAQAAPVVPVDHLLGEQVRAVHRVDARELLDLVAVLGREHPALALLAALVAVRQEQRRLARLAVEQQVRARHLDATEVVEVVRLPEARIARRARRALDDGERLVADRVVDLRAARRELLGREVGREGAEALLGGERQDHGGGESEGEQESTRHESSYSSEPGPEKSGWPASAVRVAQASVMRQKANAKRPEPAYQADRRLVRGKVSTTISSATPDT